MDELITKHSAIMDKYDPEKRIALYVDEWGTWYNPEPGRNPAFPYQQNTLRDALVAALSLNVFHRHAARVRMANIAQMVNVLEAMILMDGEKMVLTPTYHVFEMHIPFQASTALPADVESPEYRHGEWTIPAVDISAARDPQRRIQIAAVNADPRRSATATVKITGLEARAAKGRVLTAAAMDARNHFNRAPDVQPAPFSGKAEGETVMTLPPKSLVVVAVDE